MNKSDNAIYWAILMVLGMIVGTVIGIIDNVAALVKWIWRAVR